MLWFPPQVVTIARIGQSRPRIWGLHSRSLTWQVRIGTFEPSSAVSKDEHEQAAIVGKGTRNSYTGCRYPEQCLSCVCQAVIVTDNPGPVKCTL